jgi:hypothetical protein
MSNVASQSKPFVRKAVLSDCEELSKTMRQEDVQEIWHSSRTAPLEALRDGFAWPLCFTVEWRGRVVAMFGVGGERGKFGFPWMLASDDLVKIKRPFIRECRKHVDEMHKEYPVLCNMAWARNTVHVEWLKWLGFELIEARPHGPDGELFNEFFKVKPCVDH